MQTSLNLDFQIQKISDISETNNTQSKVKMSDTNKKFDDYLKKEKNVSSSTAKDNTAVSKKDGQDNIETEVEEIDDEVKKLSKDDILNCLAAIMDALNQANLENKSGNNSDKTILVDNLNSSISNSLINALNINEQLANSVSTNNTNLDPASIINNLLQLLDTKNAGELLDKKSLTIAQGLLNQLGVKLDENANNTNLVDKSFFQDLLSQVKDEVNSLLGSNSKKEVGNSDSINKLITLKEDSKNSNIEGKNSASEKSDFAVKESSAYDKSSDNGGFESNKDSNKYLSKEEKILKSILGEDSTETTKIPVFTTNSTSNVNVQAPKEAQVINRDTMSLDIIKSVKFMTASNMKEMIVKVNPGNLGEITIKLVEEDGNMKLNIKASAKETYSLLAQQASEIKNHLSNQNIKIQEVNIGLYEDDTTFFKDGEFQNNFSQGEDRKNNSNTNNARENYIEDETDRNELNDLSNINMLA